MLTRQKIGNIDFPVGWVDIALTLLTVYSLKWAMTREDEGVREEISHIRPIPKVIHLKVFLNHPYPKGIR